MEFSVFQFVPLPRWHCCEEFGSSLPSTPHQVPTHMGKFAQPRPFSSLNWALPALSNSPHLPDVPASLWPSSLRLLHNAQITPNGSNITKGQFQIFVFLLRSVQKKMWRQRSLFEIHSGYKLLVVFVIIICLSSMPEQCHLQLLSSTRKQTILLGRWKFEIVHSKRFKWPTKIEEQYPQRNIPGITLQLQKIIILIS